MNEELDRTLCSRYPALFAERAMLATESCMGRGIECDDGWFGILDALCSEITRLVAAKEMPEVVFQQVKEKFGGLRIYFQGGNEATRILIGMAEAMSVRTCELCGRPGTLLNSRRLVKTLCAECNLRRTAPSQPSDAVE